MYKLVFWQNKKNYYTAINNLYYTLSTRGNEVLYKTRDHVLADYYWHISNESYSAVFYTPSKSRVKEFIMNNI
jgi:hypothetical protein